MMETRIISLAESLPVRSIALRNGQTFDKCTVPEDILETVFHIGVLEDKKTLGTASFFPKDLPEYGENGFQLRMMGVLPAYQGHGIGRKIVLYSTDILVREYGGKYVWCHAREAAYTFYEKLGFEFISGEFQIPIIGTHRSMLLRL